MEGIPADIEDAKAQLEAVADELRQIDEQRQRVPALRERAGFLNGFIIALDQTSTEVLAGLPAAKERAITAKEQAILEAAAIVVDGAEIEE